MKKAEWIKKDDAFKITFDGDDFYFALDIVRNIPGRKYIDKYWLCPVNHKTYLLLKSSGFEIVVHDDGFPFEEILSGMSEILKKYDYKNTGIDESLLNGFRQYQIECVKFIEYNKGKCIISDEMGLGKTIQALGYLKIHSELRPALIVCPAFLKLNWQREIKKWLNEDSVILNGKNPYGVSYYGIIIINYDILGIKKFDEKKEKYIIEGWWKFLKDNFNLKIIISDECQYIKNGKAIRTKAFCRLARKIDKLIFLSGTPIKNKASEFFTVLNLIDNITFSSRYYYLNRYCNPRFNGFTMVYNGVSNWRELRELIESFMIRRKKKDVLKELPEKNNIIVELNTDDKEIEKYRSKVDEFNLWLKTIKKISRLGIENRIEILKQLAYAAKRNSVFKWIENFLESGEKLIICAYHRNVIDDISSYFKCDKIYGSVSMEKRQGIIDKFQNDKKIKLLIGQITAMGIGLTLTVSSNVAFIEFGWSPADHDQAADRVHRIGQKADSVNIYYLIAFDTIESDIVYMLQTKSSTVNKILDGDDQNRHFDQNILNDLYRKLKGNQ